MLASTHCTRTIAYSLVTTFTNPKLTDSQKFDQKRKKDVTSCGIGLSALPEVGLSPPGLCCDITLTGLQKTTTKNYHLAAATQQKQNDNLFTNKQKNKQGDVDHHKVNATYKKQIPCRGGTLSAR